MKNLLKKMGFGKEEPIQKIQKSVLETVKEEVIQQPVLTQSRQSVKNYPKEVLEIHHEFETAADKLLIEANNIISEAATKDVDKVKRLESLGFRQSSQVQEIKPLIEKAELSKEQIEYVRYYKQNYPFNKFITEEQVKTICHKYNLVCGEVNRFKGFVPEKNLREIERFKLKNKDKIYGIKHYLWDSWTHISEKEYLDKTTLNYLSYQFDYQILSDILQICAPIKDMDISNLELKDGYKLEKKHIPDPVVLQPVKGGYLILTAWGDEASDPLVVNEINN